MGNLCGLFIKIVIVVVVIVRPSLLEQNNTSLSCSRADKYVANLT